MGHKLLITSVLSEIPELDKVYIVPNDTPTYKSVNASMQDRYMMLKLLFAKVPKAIPAMFDKGESLTRDTVRKLCDLTQEDKITFILGSDCYLDINNWGGVEYLKKHCSLAVAERPGWSLPQETLWPEVVILKTKMPEISSTTTRILLQGKNKSKATKKMLHKDVLEYIEMKGLYAK